MHELQLAAEWTRVVARRTGDVRTELIEDAAQFLGIPVADAWHRLEGAGARFSDEWTRTVADPGDAAALTRFYNQSDTELFELIEWHANDPIHYRSLVLRALALERPGRRYLDYGSGIGNDAIVFGEAGFEVTLADISDCLLAFAAWRCRQRGLKVHTVDLKRESLPPETFDLAVCFDVLEHIPEPLPVVANIRTSMREGAIVVIHAPFGDDPDHPMHVVHHDAVTPKMRSLGFVPIDCAFPSFIRAPQVYEKRSMPLLDRTAYYIYDNYLNNAVGGMLAALYRNTVRRAGSGRLTSP